MAERRMISRSIIRQEKFLDLPLGAQAFYMHLMAEADDDGFVASAKRIARMLGTKSADMKALTEGGYITVFPSGVAYVVHWLMHNSIKKDRYKPTIYVDEKNAILEPKRNQNGTETEPQDRIDKNRIEKDREEEDRKEEDRKEYLREEEDSNAITDFNSCISEDARIESLLDIIPPEEEIPLEEEIPPELVAAIDLPVPLGGEAQPSAPTVEEVENFIMRVGASLVDAKAFHKYYSKKGWDKIGDWKQKVVRWHLKNDPKWSHLT